MNSVLVVLVAMLCTWSRCTNKSDHRGVSVFLVWLREDTGAPLAVMSDIKVTRFPSSFLSREFRRGLLTVLIVRPLDSNPPDGRAAALAREDAAFP